MILSILIDPVLILHLFLYVLASLFTAHLLQCLGLDLWLFFSILLSSVLTHPLFQTLPCSFVPLLPMFYCSCIYDLAELGKQRQKRGRKVRNNEREGFHICLTFPRVPEGADVPPQGRLLQCLRAIWWVGLNMAHGLRPEVLRTGTSVHPGKEGGG